MLKFQIQGYIELLISLLIYLCLCAFFYIKITLCSVSIRQFERQDFATLKTGNRLFCYISRGDCIKAKDPEGTIQFKVPEASLFILLIYVNMS